jgi:1-deoxy-D-xylulose-5-phosphate reductoisomerase
MEQGGNVPCVMNAANEVAVAAFLAARIGYLQIGELIERVMDQVDFDGRAELEVYLESDRMARDIAEGLLPVADARV